MFVLLFFAIMRPVRAGWSNDFIVRGDNYLSQKKYISAIVEYKKAQTISDNLEVQKRLETTRLAEGDVTKLEGFYREQNNIKQMELLNQVRAVPDSCYDLVALSKSLIEQGEPQLAIIAAQSATEMNKEYRDAWLYLGISNLETAKNVELSAENQKNYLNRAKTALTQAKTLDPTYAITNDFLKSIVR